MIRARHSRICKHKGIDPQTLEDEDIEKTLAAKYHISSKAFATLVANKAISLLTVGQMKRTSLKGLRTGKATTIRKITKTQIMKRLAATTAKRMAILSKTA